MRRSILAMMLFSFVALALSGCAGGGGSATGQGAAAPAAQPTQTAIVGKWRLTGNNGHPVPAKAHNSVEFRGDGTLSNNMDGTVLEGFYSKYTLSNDGQAVQFVGSLGSSAPFPIELAGDHLTIHAQNSHALVFARTK